MKSPPYKTKTDIVADTLREAIRSGEIEPGERIVQRELAERLEVSATPVREAIRELEAEGILAHDPHKGVRVSTVDLNTVKEIYKIRRVVEPLVTREAVPCLTEEDMDRMESILGEIVKDISQERFWKLQLPNFQMHMLIYEAANMPEAHRIIQYLWTKLPWNATRIIPGRAPEFIAETRGIIEAIRHRDKDLAAERMEFHIHQAEKAVVAHFSEPPAT